ncbi:MAG: hypothetical protein J5874_05305 [Oscillospiraceae bacterium]|nr:hypothetical protein [Oscillospiraceae bacterium]
MKKTLALILALVLFASLLVACGSGGEESKEESSQVSAVSEDESEVEEPSEEVSVYVPDIYSGNDYEGETFTVWTTYSTATNTSSIIPNEVGTYEENISEGCNIAIKQRNNMIFDTLGVTIDEIYYQSPTRYGTDTLSKIRNYISASDPSISAFACCLYDCGTLALEGSLYDLNSFEYFEPKNPWWQQYFNESVTLGGKLYFTIGDIDYNSYSRIPCVVYNDTLIKKLNLESPVKLAREGKWTIDKVIEYSKTFCEDTNDPEGVDLFDRFGWGGNHDDFYSMTYAAGIRILQNDKNGYPELSLYNEDTINYLNKYMEFAHEDTYVCVNDYFNISSNPGGLLYDAFQEGRCLMFGGSLRACTLLEMEDIFGIAPMPKADEHQEYYYSLLNTWTANAYGIGTNLDQAHAEFAAAILDVMGYYSWRENSGSFIQNYYDMALKGQKLQTEEAEEMLDLIFSVRGCEPGSIFQIGKYSVFTTVNELYVGLYTGRFDGFTSAYDRFSNGFENDVQHLVNKIKSLEE